MLNPRLQVNPEQLLVRARSQVPLPLLVRAKSQVPLPRVTAVAQSLTPAHNLLLVITS